MPSRKDEYLRKLDAMIEERSAQIAALKQKLELRAAEGQAELRRTLDALESKLEDTKAKAKQIAEATDDAWEGIRDSLEEAWDGVSSSLSGLFSRLR